MWFFECSFNSFELLRRQATVILEPLQECGPENDFLTGIRDLSSRQGAVLIFDEVVSGFRIALGGAQEYYGVIPDMAAIGKGMANGMPLSVYLGRKECMDILDECIISSTYGGETLSLAAAKATISTYLDEKVIDHLRLS